MEEGAGSDPPQDNPDVEDVDSQQSSSDEEFEEDVEVLYPQEEQNFHSEEVYSVDFRPGITVSGGGDHKAVVYQGEAAEIEYHTDSIIFVGFSHCGKYLALGSMDAKVSVWTIGNWTAPHAVFEGLEGEATWVCWHPKGPVLVAGSGDGSNWVWDVRTQALLAVLQGEGNISSCGLFSPNGRYVCSGGKGIRVWDLKQMSGGQAPCIASFPRINDESIAISIAMREDNAVIVAGHSTGIVQGVSITHSQPLFQLNLYEDSVESVGFSSVMPWLAVGAVTGGLKIIDVSSGTVRCSIETPGIVKLLWKDGRLFVGFLDGTVREYEGSGLRLLKVFKANKAQLLDFAVSNDKVMKSGEDGKVFIFSQTQEE